MKTLHFLIFIALLSLFSSCATVGSYLSGHKNTLVIEAGTPEEAEVYLDGKLLGTTPLKIKVPEEQIQHFSVLEIRKKGYQSKQYTIERKLQPTYTVVNTITTVGLAMAVDVADGKIYRPKPRKFTYHLQPIE